MMKEPTIRIAETDIAGTRGFVGHSANLLHIAIKLFGT
jgi:hypothetical protein